MRTSLSTNGGEECYGTREFSEIQNRKRKSIGYLRRCAAENSFGGRRSNQETTESFAFNRDCSETKKLMRLAIGAIPIWVFDNCPLGENRTALESDIHKLVSDGVLNTNAYGTQTKSVLQKLNGTHWRRFFDHVGDCVADIDGCGDLFLNEGECHVRVWASILRRGEVGPDDLSRLVHNHPGSILSFVYYLSGGEGGGTSFINPSSQFVGSESPVKTIEWKAGRAVFFDSKLLHYPSLESFDIQDLDDDRIVIAADIHYVPEEPEICCG